MRNINIRMNGDMTGGDGKTGIEMAGWVGIEGQVEIITEVGMGEEVEMGQHGEIKGHMEKEMGRHGYEDRWILGRD